MNSSSQPPPHLAAHPLPPQPVLPAVMPVLHQALPGVSYCGGQVVVLCSSHQAVPKQVVLAKIFSTGSRLPLSIGIPANSLSRQPSNLQCPQPPSQTSGCSQ